MVREPQDGISVLLFSHLGPESMGIKRENFWRYLTCGPGARIAEQRVSGTSFEKQSRILYPLTLA